MLIDFTKQELEDVVFCLRGVTQEHLKHGLDDQVEGIARFHALKDRMSQAHSVLQREEIIEHEKRALRREG